MKCLGDKLRPLKKLVFRLEKLKKALFIKRLRMAFLKHYVLGSTEHEYVLRQTNPDHVVDIGANKGQFALAVRAYTGATVISFEPLPKPASIFRKIFENDSHVVLHPVAIGPVSEVVKMNIAGREDSSSILPIAELQSQIFPGTSKVGEIRVSVGPLANYLKSDIDLSNSLLKIDVQGYEFEVLKGCGSLLDRFKFIYCECSFVELYSGQSLANEIIGFLQSRGFKFIYCECSFVELYSGQSLANEIIGFLQSRGFKLIGMFNAFNDRSERLIQADFLFENNSASTTK